MAIKKINMHYFYPLHKDEDKEKLVCLSEVLNVLKEMEAKDRVLEKGEENIQLKKIEFDEDSKMWSLCFLRNRIDAPFITKLDDDTNEAEQLDDDEFVGQECCMIYDENSKIISLQSNRASISCGGVAEFFNKYFEENIYLSAIVYKKKYTEISEDKNIEYRSVIIGYTDIEKIVELSEKTTDDDKMIKSLAKIASNLSAVNGKIEFNVGRKKQFLSKEFLSKLINIFKKNPEITNSLKVKMLDNDTIRLVDLISNKVSDSVEIVITKSDPKTFDKILNVMNASFKVALDETFDKCVKFVEK